MPHVPCLTYQRPFTFYRWLKDGENAKSGVKRTLYDEIKKAKAYHKKCLLTTIKDAAMNGAQYWTAAAWLPERKYPMEYGKMEHKAEEADNAPVRLHPRPRDRADGRRLRRRGRCPVITVSDYVIPRFHPVLGDVMAHGHTHYWLPGGRGSTKSSFISIAIVLLIIANPKANAVVVRRFSNTLRDSVYQRIQWAIEVLGLEGVFRCRVSPMEITYVPTGQRIVFRGSDDPLKLKGVKFTKGYCSIVWFEELDQFEGPDAVRSILNSLRRGGDRFWIFYSYNPPKTMWSWVNVKRLERLRRADTLVRGSSYLDVIESHPDWLGAPFVEEAEYLRDTNEKA